MASILRIVFSIIRAFSVLGALAFFGLGLIEVLRLVGPDNIPGAGPYTFLALAGAALGVAIVAHAADLVLSRLAPRVA